LIESAPLVVVEAPIAMAVVVRWGTFVAKRARARTMEDGGNILYYYV